MWTRSTTSWYPGSAPKWSHRSRSAEGSDAGCARVHDAHHVGRLPQGLVVGDHRGTHAEAEEHDAAEAAAAQDAERRVDVEGRAVHQPAAEDDPVVGHPRVGRHHREARVREREREPPRDARDVVADRPVHHQHGEPAPVAPRPPRGRKTIPSQRLPSSVSDTTRSTARSRSSRPKAGRRRRVRRDAGSSPPLS